MGVASRRCDDACFAFAAGGGRVFDAAKCLYPAVSALYSQRYDAEPRHFSSVPLVSEVMIYLFKMAAAQAQKWQPDHDWLNLSAWILLPLAVVSWLIASYLWHRLVK